LRGRLPQGPFEPAARAQSQVRREGADEESPQTVLAMFRYLY